MKYRDYLIRGVLLLSIIFSSIVIYSVAFNITGGIDFGMLELI